MVSSLSSILYVAAAASLPNAASASVDVQHGERNQVNTQQRRTQVDFGDDASQTATLPPEEDEAFNYRSCGSGINQAGFATLQFLYDIETNVTMSASSYLTERQQELQEQQLEFLESKVFPEIMSTALLERLQEKACGITFYQPVLEVISISSGKDDEVWDTCNLTVVESRSCTRYLGSVLIGVNNTAILGSVNNKVGKFVFPVMAADMFEGWYAQWMSDSLASTKSDDGVGITDFVGGVQVTRVGFVGEPIFAQESTETSASGVESGKLTGWGYVLLFLGLWLLLSICCFFYYVYSNILKGVEEEALVEKKTIRNEDGDNNTNNNNTFTMESEEDEEEAQKSMALPPPRQAPSNSYDESYARQIPTYNYSDDVPLALPPPPPPPRQQSSSFSRMGILPIDTIDANASSKGAVLTPLQTPQANRLPMAHRRVQSTGGNNNDFYQFHPTTPAGAANDPRFISVTPQDHHARRSYETPVSPPRLSYRDYEPEPAASPYEPYGSGSSIPAGGGGVYNNYSLDRAQLAHQLPSSYTQEVLNNSLPEWTTPQQRRPQYDEDDYHHSRSRQPGTTTTVVDSRGRVRKEIAL